MPSKLRLKFYDRTS